MSKKVLQNFKNYDILYQMCIFLGGYRLWEMKKEAVLPGNSVLLWRQQVLQLDLAIFGDFRT